MGGVLVLPYLSLALFGCVPRYADLPSLAPDELWAPLPVQHLEVMGVDVAFVDSGTRSAEPPLVFIHGLSSYMGFWEYQVPEFARDRRVLALDLPGYGASGRPDAPYTPPWYADLVAAWLTDLSIDQADVVGHSMGGQIAMTLALEHPARVNRLVLSAPAGIETFNAGAADWMRTYWTESRALEATELELRAVFETTVFNRKDEGVERLLQERVRMSDTPAFRGTSVAVSRSIHGMVDHPVYTRLGNVRAKTLIVYGTDDRMIPNPVFTGGSTRAIAERAQRAIPNSELVMIPGAGHTVHHDAPETFNAEVARFLRESK